jgi:DnaJ-domain-containing protein 1
MTMMISNKTVSETLQDLRILFNRYNVEEWEPVRSEQDLSYSVRYRKDGQWVTISSRLQATRAKNLRQCHQVIQFLFLWASRGVGGVSQGVTFIHGGLVRVGEGQDEDGMAEAYATLGVDPDDSLDEIGAVYRAKIKFNHPDGVQDPQEKRTREERTSRLNGAWGLIEKARAAK